MTFTSPEQQRAILALSFERSDDGYIYYHNRWSRGVPVTPEEREAYLSIPIMGSRRAWRKAVANRQTLPPRAYGPVQKELLAELPMSMGLLALTFGGIGVASGLAEPQPILAVTYMAAGFSMIVFGAALILARIGRRR